MAAVRGRGSVSRDWRQKNWGRLAIGGSKNSGGRGARGSFTRAGIGGWRLAAGALAAVIGWWLAVVRGCEEGEGGGARGGGTRAGVGGWRLAAGCFGGNYTASALQVGGGEGR